MFSVYITEGAARYASFFVVTWWKSHKASEKPACNRPTNKSHFSERASQENKLNPKLLCELA